MGKNIKTKKDLLMEVERLRSELEDAKAEVELARLASFPQLNPNPVVEVDLTGHIHYSNPAAEQLFPELKKVGLQHPWLTDLEKINEVLERGQKSMHARELKVGDHWYQQTVHSVLDGTRLRIYGFDITEHKQAEQERERLRAEAEKERLQLEAVMETLAVGIAITDVSGGHIRSNKTFKQIWGSPRPVVRSITDYADIKAWWSETGKPVASEEWASAQVIKKGRPVIGQLLEIERFDGSNASVINSGTPIFDADGKITGCAVAIQDITDLREAERALRESESKYRSLFKNMINGFAYHKVLVDDQDNPIDYVFLEVNGAFENLTGLKKENIVGKRATEVLSGIEHDPANWIEAYGRVARTGEPIKFENYSENLSKWYSVSAYSPEKGYFAAVFEDITPRKRAEELARQRLAEIEDLYRNAPVGLCVLDRELRWVRINERLAEINGIPAADHIGKRVRDLMPELADAVEPGMRRVLETGQPRLNIEIASKTPSQLGVIRSWMEQWLPIMDAHGEVTGLSVVVEEITERKQAEQERERLRAGAETEKRRLEALMESLPVGVALTDAQGGTIRSNKAFEQLWGSPRPMAASVADYTAYKAWWPETGKPVVSEEWASAQAMEKGEAVVGQLIEIQRFDGSRASVINSGAPIFDADGKIAGCAVAIQDITALRKAEEAVRNSKERFELLSETAGKLLITDKPQEVVNELCQKVMTYLDCHTFFNYLVDEGKGQLHLNAYAGISEKTGKEIEWLDYGVAVCGCAARDACRIVAEDIPNTPDPRTELVKSFGIKAYACHPLFSAGRVIGTLSFGTRSRTTFNEEELELMKTVADQVAVAMERIRLVEALRRSRDELEIKVKQRTAELAKANELLERMFSSIDIMIAYMDKDFNFIRVNRAYAQADEREPEFYVGKNHFILFPNEENQQIFRKVVETGEPYLVYAKPFEYAERPERGVTHWDWNLQPVKDPDGSIGGVVLSLVNVTERIRAQEAVAAERQQFNSVLEMLPAYLVLLTPDYHVPFANRFFRERFGESHGRCCFEYLFGRTEPCEICETYSVLKTNAPHHWEWTGPDGHIYDVFDFPFTDTDGSTLILEMGIDITERKKAEEAVRTASLYTRSLIEASLDPLITISAAGKIMDVNSATELITGIPRDALIGTDFSDYFTEPEKAKEGYQRVFREGFIRDYPLAIRHVSGKVTDVLYHATVYKNEAGEIQGVFAAARDITTRKRAEEALRESENRLRLLSSQLINVQEAERKRIAREVHDSIGQSLSAIKFKVESITREMRERRHKKMAESIETLLPIIKTSIEESRKIQMDLRPSILDDLGILATVAWFIREFQRVYSHISIQDQINVEENQIPGSLKIVLFRILQEAMNNIAKHSKADLVRLSLRKKETRIELSIKDNGAGFDLDSIKQGMGMTSMQERTELSGGTFTINSTPGSGTMIKVSWPI